MDKIQRSKSPLFGITSERINDYLLQERNPKKTRVDFDPKNYTHLGVTERNAIIYKRIYD